MPPINATTKTTISASNSSSSAPPSQPRTHPGPKIKPPQRSAINSPKQIIFSKGKSFLKTSRKLSLPTTEEVLQKYKKAHLLSTQIQIIFLKPIKNGQKMSTLQAFIYCMNIIFHFIYYSPAADTIAPHLLPPILQPCLSHAHISTKQTRFSAVTLRSRYNNLLAIAQEPDRLIDSHTHRTFDLGQHERFDCISQPFATLKPTPVIVAMSMITTRSGKANNGLSQIEELRLKNKEINDKKREEEAAKQREKEKEEASKKAATITPRNLLNSMTSGKTQVTPEANTEDDDLELLPDIETLMDIGEIQRKDQEEQAETSELSPVKKRSKGKRSTSSRPRPNLANPTPTDSANSTNAKSATFLDEVVYPHSRVIIELAILLKSDKAFEEFTQALMAFITNAQMVDPKFVINPIKPSSKEKNISNKSEISPNMTKLGIHIKISGNGNAFNKKKVWNNQTSDRKSRKVRKDEFRDPVIYFSMVISTEVEPLELIDRVTHEWSRLNGTRLQVKDLQSISSETVVTFFKVSTATPKNVILAELTKILLEAQNRSRNDYSKRDELFDLTAYDFTLDEGIEMGESLPPMNLRVQNALLRGQEVTAFNRLSHQAQQARKSWHLEVDSKHAAKMKALIQCAKTYGCVEEMWGPHAHLSEVTDATSTAREAKRQVDVAQSHTNYQLSMVAEELVGVVNLDEPLAITHPESGKEIGQLSLRTALLNYLKMQDGHPMIAEVHQEDICKPTHIIVPHTEEAERMVGMMNKNLPAFLYHMLLEIDFTEDIVSKLLKTSCETSLVTQISQCKWHSGTRTLTTPEEERKSKAVKALESAAWFKDEFGLLKKGPKPMMAIPQEAQFNLDGTSSIKTIHDRHLQQPTSILKKTPAGPQPDSTTKAADVDLTKDDDEDSSRDSASQTSSSSEEEEDQSSSDEGSHSKTSTNDDEEMSAAGSG